MEELQKKYKTFIISESKRVQILGGKVLNIETSGRNGSLRGQFGQGNSFPFLELGE